MPEALKDQFFTPAFYDDLAAVLGELYPPFDRNALLAAVYDEQWEERTLMARMRHTMIVLHPLLPGDYRTALAVLKAAAPRLTRHGFALIGFPEYVALHGLDDWDASLPALEHFTQLMSAEFAVRPFILRDPPRMMAQMRAWATHPHEQVRRLASEGCRPRLPWGVALAAFKQDPAPVLEVLELLKDDPAETVRRSVANNLNDIAKDNPQVVIGVLRRWQQDASPERQWIIRHALRTLVKAGHSEALALLGFSTGAQVNVTALAMSAPSVRLGEEIRFSAVIESHGEDTQRLVIDYVVYYVKANGQQAPKVFKLTTVELAPGESLRLERKISFRPITTRVYYAGEHRVMLKINGQLCAPPDTPEGVVFTVLAG